MRFISLFSGIGGFDLGFERAGMQCAAQVEFDDKASAVLASHWPDVMENVRPLVQPIPVRGAQGLFTVELDL